LVSPGCRRESISFSLISHPGQPDTMPAVSLEKAKAVLSEFTLVQKKTSFDTLEVGYENYTKFINEFWTAKQRQANSIHEISYRACYKLTNHNYRDFSSISSLSLEMWSMIRSLDEELH